MGVVTVVVGVVVAGVVVARRRAGDRMRVRRARMDVVVDGVLVRRAAPVSPKELVPVFEPSATGKRSRRSGRLNV